jgi:hypothetical protein
MAANALLCLAALRVMERPSRRAALAAAGTGYLAYLVRPDQAIVGVLVPILAAVVSGDRRLPHPDPLPRAGGEGEREGERVRGRGAMVLLVVAMVVGLFVVDMVVKRLYFGMALPLAFHAKRPGAYGGFAGEYTWNPFLFLRVFLVAAVPAVAVTVLAAGRRTWRDLIVFVAPVAIGFAVLFSRNQIMGHLGRLFFPALPFLVVAAARSLGALPRGRPLALRAATTAAVLGLGYLALGAAGDRYEARAAGQRLAPLGGYQVDAAQPLPELDSWRSAEEVAAIAAAAPAGTRFAMSEHGLPGARAPHVRIVDMLGLHDPAFALARFSAGELWRRRPDAIWLPHPDHTQMVRDILDSDELWSHYDVYPEAFSFGLALRRDSPRFALLDAAFRQRWAAAYPGVDPDRHRGRRAVPRDAGSGTLSP